MSDTTLQLGGFSLRKTTRSSITKELASVLNTDAQKVLFYANTNLIVKCQSMRDAMQHEDIIIVNDGIGVDIATWLIHRDRFTENLNGTDFTPRFLAEYKDSVRVFLLGGKAGIAERASNTLSSTQGVTVVGYANGYDEAKDVDALLEKINASNANVILVAMGNPYQEQWIIQHRAKIRVNLLMGVGALLDFLAGDKPRAPALIQKLRLEWLYRLMLEPTRLMRRYTLDIIVFLRICLKADRQLHTSTHSQ